jgi:serine phosphatase RsbU (regulator of sigma subunit)
MESTTFYNDKTTLKVILFSGMLIVVSIVLIGVLVNYFAEDAAVEKLKTKDLPLYAESIAEKIDQRIKNAQEMSLFLARDPGVVRWVREKEKDAQLQADALSQLSTLVKEHHFNNSFIVSALTNNYWSEEGRVIDTLDKNDPDDSWFFATLEAGAPVEISVDFNEERKDTFVFVNALIGPTDRPEGVAGVGFAMDEMSEYIKDNKLHQDSRVWLVDKEGTIDLSDRQEDSGHSIEEMLPAKIREHIWGDSFDVILNQTAEFKDDKGNYADLIIRPLQIDGTQLVVQMPRSYSTSHLVTMRWNSIFAIIISIVSIGFLFLYITRRLANPYKRALEMNERLEQQVSLRTKQLQETHEAILDSIHYAKRIQVSLLPFESIVHQSFKDHFVLWQPRDVVGGDFYWVKETEHGCIVAVGDCTGHGVPGALMTMLAVSSLEQIVMREKVEDPAHILSQHHLLMQKLLGQGTGASSTDDGLDLGVCFLRSDGKVFYAGASISLYIWEREELQRIQGNKRGLGYSRTPVDYEFTQHEWTPSADAVFYMSTDGFRDQNGGEKNYSFGRKRFEALIRQHGKRPLAEQKEEFHKALTQFRGAEPQRDDITVFAFRAE